MPSRRPIARLIVLLALGWGTAGAAAFELRGFRGVEWGEGVQALGQARLSGAEAGVGCYQRERENLLFGDSALHAVRYCFQAGRLVLVILDAATDVHTLAQDLARTYGQPDLMRPQGVSWGTSRSNTRAELSRRGHGTARLTLYTQALDAATARRLHAHGVADAPQFAVVLP